MINAIHQIVSRRLDPIDSGVITIGTIQGGTVNNVIPDTVEMSGTIRSMTPEGRELLHNELRKACGIVEPLGGSFDLEIVYGYPPTVNAVEATEIMFQSGAELVGAAQMHEKDPVMGAEDFSYMAQVTPGCMFNIGVHDPAWGDNFYPVHRADFRLDENALPLGAAALANAAIRWMEKHG